MPGEVKDPTQGVNFMCNLSWTPHSNLEKDNSLKTTPVLAQRWAVWSILTKNWVSGSVSDFVCVTVSDSVSETLTV